jgi:hypothetical protein
MGVSIVGGFVVSLFAVLGDLLKPENFAGLFRAAPSVALATTGLTVLADGQLYAALEARSMIVGAAAFLAYTAVCTRVMAKRDNWHCGWHARWAGGCLFSGKSRDHHF